MRRRLQSASSSVVASMAFVLSACGSDVPPVVSPVVPAPVMAPIPVATPVTTASLVLLDLAASDVVSRVAPSGQPDAGLTAVTTGNASALAFTCQAGSSWPGIAIKPVGAEWNLAAFGAVEADLANVGSAPVTISLRVDETPKLWNSESVRIAPGATATVKVYFGTSFGKPGPAVATAHITNVLLFANAPTDGTKLQLRRLAAVGKPGDKQSQAEQPKPITAHHVPAAPQVLAFTPAFDRSHLQTGALQVELNADAALITAPTASPALSEVVYRPAQPLDLRDYNQAVFTVRNPGATPVRVALRLQGAAPDDLARREIEIAAGSRERVVVSFASPEQWRGVMPGAPPVSDKPFLGAATERTSVGLASSAVSAIAVGIIAPAAGQQLAWEGVVAEVSAPTVIPAWVGTRPPVPGDWVKTFNDDFNGDQLDLTHWTPRLPWIGPIPWEFQRYNDKNVSVSGGFMRIHCEKQTGHLYDNPAWPSRDYTTGAMTTYDKWSVRYGYIETRFKLPKANGLWPAFWTMPDRGAVVDGKPLAKGERRDTGHGGMEFDIFEHPNRFGPFRYNIACHWDGYGKEHRSTGSSRVFAMPDAEGFVVAGFLWEPGKVTWYCNGEPVGSWQDERVSNVPASLKYTVQMGGWAGNEVDDAALPDDFVVDWVRVWQRRELLEPGKAIIAP